MKKKLSAFIILCLGGILLTNPLSLVAGGSSHGAVIDGTETNAEYGSILDYMNTNGRIKRSNYISYIRDWKAGSYKYYTIGPDDNIQTIKNGTLTLKTTVGNMPHSLEAINTMYGLEIILAVTNDGIHYEDVTNQLNAAGVYDNAQSVKGYYLEFKMPTNVDLDERVAAEVTHDIDIDYSRATTEQLLGQAPLDQWKDSKRANQDPTPNYQRTYIINPEISGTIKYQTIADESAIPSWTKATAIAGIPVDLVKQDGTIIASTTTKTDGTFIFSNVVDDATTFNLDTSLEQLYIAIDGQGKKEWRDIDAVMSLNTDNMPLGTIVDISKSQATFEAAIDKTTWNVGYMNHNLAGYNALDSKYILTEIGDTETTDNNEEPIIPEIPKTDDETLVTTGSNQTQLSLVLGVTLIIVSSFIVVVSRKKEMK